MTPELSNEPGSPAARRPLRSLVGALGNRLLAGIAFAVPLLVTYWVLSFGYRLVNGLSEPWLQTLGINIQGRLGHAAPPLALRCSRPPA